MNVTSLRKRIHKQSPGLCLLCCRLLWRCVKIYRLSINRSKMFLSKTTRISLGRYSTNIKGTLISDLYTFLRTKISKLEKSNFESTKRVQVCAHGGKFESDERWLRLRFAPLLVCSWLNAISDILTKLNHPVEWCKRIECLTGCLIVAGKNGVPLCVP